MRVSVALCTFNGERYLGEQLDSLGEQTRLPDELVVHDDVSTDRSREILRGFAASAPFPVRLTVNAERLGSTANFANAIRAASGEIVALCDQDDVWRPEKLARIEAALGAAPQAACVFTDAEVVDADLTPLGYTLWHAVRLDRSGQRRMATGRAVDVLLRQNVVTGATMAFRSELRDLALPIPAGWVHDGWIALLAAAVGGCVPVPEPLVRYRQHATQQIGGRRRTLGERVAAARRMDAAFFTALQDNYERARARLAERGGSQVRDATLRKLDAKIEHCRRRARIRARRGQLALIATELASGRYSRYSLGWRSVASDLVL